MIIESTFTIARAVAPGDEILAIGDIHGEVGLLEMLLDHAAALPPLGRRVLVQTGDLIDRGPSSLATLALAARAGALALAARAGALVGAAEQVDLMGNHEQMLLVGLGGNTWWRRQAYTLWIENGGDAVLQEIFGDAWFDRHDPASAREALGGSLAFLRGMRPHMRSGDVLFVHVGVSPTIPMDTFLAAPWDVSFDTFREDAHWAWIRDPFLRARSHWGLFVCHGHTPGDGVARTGAETVARDRLNLDVGSCRMGMARMARFVGHVVTVYDAILPE